MNNLSKKETQLAAKTAKSVTANIEKFPHLKNVRDSISKRVSLL